MIVVAAVLVVVVVGAAVCKAIQIVQRYEQE